MVVAARLQDCPGPADGSVVAPSSTTPAPAFDAALRRVELLCRTLATGIPRTATLLVDRHMCVRLAVGPAWSIGGYEPEEMVGRRIEDLLPAAVTDTVRPHYEA